MLGVLYYCRLVVLQHSYWSNVSNRSVDIYFSAHMTRFWNNFTSKNYQTNKFKISERKKHKKSKQDSPNWLGLHMPAGQMNHIWYFKTPSNITRNFAFFFINKYTIVCRLTDIMTTVTLKPLSINVLRDLKALTPWRTDISF